MVQESYQITSFKTFNNAVDKILGYAKYYDNLKSDIYKDIEYYKNEIESQDYSYEDLKAIVIGNYNNYEIDFIHTFYNMIYPNSYSNAYIEKYDLLIDVLSNKENLCNEYFWLSDLYNNNPTRKYCYQCQNIIKDTKRMYKIICKFEDKYKPKEHDNTT
jgi:hypothetical protein